MNLLLVNSVDELVYYLCCLVVAFSLFTFTCFGFVVTCVLCLIFVLVFSYLVLSYFLVLVGFVGLLACVNLRLVVRILFGCFDNVVYVNC